MKEPNPETNERISRRFFNMVVELVRDLEKEGDQDGIDTLPTVMLTTGVMTMCQSMSAETVGMVLDALRVKVERGDFSSSRDVDET